MSERENPIIFSNENTKSNIQHNSSNVYNVYNIQVLLYFIYICSQYHTNPATEPQKNNEKEATQLIMVDTVCVYSRSNSIHVFEAAAANK